MAVAGVMLLLVLFLIWMAVLTLLSGKAQRVPVLVYHNFSWENDVSDNNKVLTPRTVFLAQMEYLHDNGYHVIPLKKLIEYMQSGGDLPEKAVVITFDDGYESNYTLAYPILKHYNMPATIFLIAGSVHPNVPGEPSMLTWEEMREMESSGLIDIQAHTFNLHRKVYINRERTRQEPAVIARAYLPELERRETAGEFTDKLYNDFVKSRATIEINLQKQVDTMAWPYGVYNMTSMRLARKAGFKYLLTLKMGMNEYGDSVQVIRRVNAGGEMPLSNFAKLIEPDYSYVRQFRQVTFRYLYRFVEFFAR